MFNSMEKDFKSPVSTVPPRGQATAIKEKSARYDAGFHPSKPPFQTRHVGTDTQNPAHGTIPIAEGASEPAFQEHFWSRVNKSGDCWEWIGGRQRGYGRTRVPGTRAHFWAHRLAYFYATGDDPGPMSVCHRCDNPPCCNPAHLFLGTHADNMADKIAKGRGRTGPSVGAQNPNAKLTEADACKVIGLLMAGRKNTEIAKVVPVGHALISRIRVGKAWRQLSESMGYVPKPSSQAPKSGRTAYKA